MAQKRETGTRLPSGGSTKNQHGMDQGSGGLSLLSSGPEV